MMEEGTDLELGEVQGRNLYDEARGQMGAAFLMFLVADIREMARNGELSGNPDVIRKMIDFPLDAYEFVTIYKENREAILKKIDSEELYEMYASFFGIPEDADEKTAETLLRSHSMLFFEDSNSEEDMVYAIGIDHIKKQVNVAFRGSVTPEDFRKDAKALFAPIPNPVKIPEDGEDGVMLIDPLLKTRILKYVQVHLGFREYLYGAVRMPDLIKSISKASREQFEAATSASGSVMKAATNTLVPQQVQEASGRATEAVLDSAKKATASTASGVKKASGSATSLVGNAAKKVSDASTEFLSGTKDKSASEIDAESGGLHDETPAESSTEKATNVTDEEVGVAETKPKYIVMLEMVSEILKQNEGYSLYVSGHSLGGALAVLFAFEAAAADDDLIPKPVTCITTGAPKAGNLDFLYSFEALEAQKKVRYLRICNFRDIVPLSPPNGAYNCALPLFCQSQRFRHVGLRLKLYPKGYTITFSPKMRTWPGIFLCDFIKIFRHYAYLFVICPIVLLCKNAFTYRVFRKEHTQPLYMDRFDACQEIFEDMTLDELYEERIHRAKWRRPVLRNDMYALKKEEYMKKPYKTFEAILAMDI